MGLLDSILDFFSKSSDLNQYPSQYQSQPTIREAEKDTLPKGISGLGSIPGPGTFGFGGSFSGPSGRFGGSFSGEEAPSGIFWPTGDEMINKADPENGINWAGLGEISGKNPRKKMSALNGVTQEEADKLTNAMLYPSDYFDLLSGVDDSVDPSIYERGYENKDFDINAPKMSALNGVTQEEADKLTREMGLPFTPFFGLPNEPVPSADPSIYERGYENKDFDINAPKMSALNGVTQEEADKLTMEMGLPFTPFFGLPSGPIEPSTNQQAESSSNGTAEQGVNNQTQQPDKSYNSHAVTTEMDEFYETLKNNPELAEKYAEYLDEDNYGYSRARASQNSDLFADLALADPRIMQRFKNSGVDVEDLENLSNNIYKYMWEDNLIDLYDYYDNKSGYLGDSDKSVIDMLGFLMQDSNYNFDSDFIRRYDLNPEDAMVQALIRNAYAGGAREYDLGRITDLMRRSGYLADDEELTWGDASNSWWVDNDKNRANLPEYVSLRDTQYLDPQKGVYDTNAALSLADAMAIADSQLLDANGKAPSRRVVVSSKNPQKNKQKAFDSAVLDASTAGTGLGYY